MLQFWTEMLHTFSSQEGRRQCAAPKSGRGSFSCPGPYKGSSDSEPTIRGLESDFMVGVAPPTRISALDILFYCIP